jgi:hypothetical protein
MVPLRNDISPQAAAMNQSGEHAFLGQPFQIGARLA